MGFRTHDPKLGKALHEFSLEPVSIRRGSLKPITQRVISTHTEGNLHTNLRPGILQQPSVLRSCTSPMLSRPPPQKPGKQKGTGRGMHQR